MKAVLIICVASVFGIIEAYDFEDSIYNHILINELEDMQWDNNKLFHPRSKRGTDEKCKSKYFRSCCEEDYFWELYEEDKSLKAECHKEVTGKEPEDSIIDLLKCNKSEQIKRDIGCIAECAAKKKGIVDDEGFLKETEAKKSFREKVAKIEWLAVKGDDIFAKCIAVGNDAGTSPRENGYCNPATSKYLHCMWKEIQSSCPAERIADEAKCKKIRDNINSLEMYAA